ncbi:unnamed protein product [Boreogadus saida]
MTVPGPHAFLLVVPLGRFTEEENMAVTIVTMLVAVFGEAAVRNHTAVLFSWGDVLEEPIHEYLASAPTDQAGSVDQQRELPGDQPWRATGAVIGGLVGGSSVWLFWVKDVLVALLGVSSQSHE